MTWSVLHMCLLLTVYGSDGQSTSADPRCVYTFNVPTSDCAQTPGPSVDDQLLKGYVIALQEQFKQVVTDVRDLRERNDKLERDNKKLMSDVENLKKDTHSGNMMLWGWSHMGWPGSVVTPTDIVSTIKIVLGYI